MRERKSKGRNRIGTETYHNPFRILSSSYKVITESEFLVRVQGRRGDKKGIRG